MQLTRFVCK